MGKVDSLSRRLDWEVEVERDNENEVLIKPEWLKIRRTETVEIVIEGMDLLEEVRKLKVKDDKVVKAVEEIKQAVVKVLRDEEWREVDGVMYKEGKVYISKDEKLRVEIVRLYHNIHIEGHRGQWKMVELVTRNFWWSGVTKEIKRYVEGCNSYQRNKNHTE